MVFIGTHDAVANLVLKSINFLDFVVVVAVVVVVVVVVGGNQNVTVFLNVKSLMFKCEGLGKCA